MLGFRHCDSRFGFAWQSQAQPAARWHGDGEGPVNYFADTPTGAWAEFLRHECIRDPADLAGVRRSLWAVEMNDAVCVAPTLPAAVLQGDERSYPACQREAARLRALGAPCLEAPSAALLPGGASGWTAAATLARASPARDGRVRVVFGPSDAVGWPCVEGGSPPASTLALVRHF